MRTLFALALTLIFSINAYADKSPFHHKSKLVCPVPRNTRNDNQNNNTNGNQNTNTVKVNVSSGTGSSSSSSSSSSTNGSGTSNGIPGTTFNISPTDARQFSSQPSFSPTHSPQYYPGASSIPAGIAAAAPLLGVEAPVAAVGAPAALSLELPQENAEVFLNDVKMPHVGLTRKFVTPPLLPAKVYYYSVKVVWPGDMGGIKMYTTQIELRAGDDILHTVPPEGGIGGKLAAPPMPKPGNAPAVNALAANKANPVNDWTSRLKLAKMLLKDGLKNKAKIWLQEIVDKAPGTPAAKEAQEILDALK